ncbi:hypothetical protein WUBG_16930 [Wuchereria bancrofti]|nr:hypothetical protein WUBG_16930 [Wuchereria bancrofti]
METVVVNFHDNDGYLNNVTLRAGDDAIKLRWITVSLGQKLYASHEDFIKLLAQHHGI